MEPDAHLFKNFCKESVCSSIHIVGGNHLITWNQQAENSICSCYATAEAQPVPAIFNMGQRRFERRAGGILRTGIFISFMYARSGLNISGGLVDRGHDSTRGRVGFYAGVDQLG